MIRNNKHQTSRGQYLQQTAMINYRNALYQGQYSRQKQQRQGRGIIYQSNTHHFIACNNFNQNKICEEVLFFHSHSHYHYGRWNNNQPHGVCIFRLNQILIITEYQQGKLTSGTNVLFIFEKYCMGIIIEAEENNRWSIRSKSEVFLFEHMQNLIKECDFYDSQIVSPSLIKFLNRQFTASLPNSFKLRLINNQHYRYGFDQGLAIFFNDQFRILSVGFHNKNDLSDDIGIKFSSKDVGGVIQQGVFDGVRTFVFEREKKPQLKIGQMYSRHHLSSINFKNQFFIDPSQQYFRYFEKIMGQRLFQDMVSQLVNISSLNNDLFKDEKPVENIPDRYKKLQFDELQVPTFKKAYIESIKSQKMKQMFSEQSSIRLYEKFQDKNYQQQASSFDRLSQRNRLEIMKKQLQHSLVSKQIQLKLPTDRSKKQLQIEQRSSSKQSVKEIEESKKSQKFFDEKFSESKSQRQRKANLQQKIDIIIRQPTPQENIHSKSRTKKKIFQLSKSVKRGYSPEVQASPFKSKMKSRIFDMSHERSPSRSKSRSSRKIFQKPRYSKSPLKAKANEEYLSPHLQLGFSIDKSSGSSQIASFPVTMTKQSKLQNNPKESEGVQDEGSINIRTVKQSQTKISLKENFKMKEEQLSQYKRNQIYRNPIINGGYNEYIYEPINIKQTGNTPYLKNSSLKSLSKNKSNSQLLQNPSINVVNSKKIIQETSPFKKTKMSGYLNQEKEYRPNTKYSDYKKRTGYF